MLEADDGTVLASHGEAIGVATNNVAEYRGLVEGLRKAGELGVGEIEVVSDSELIVKQMRGEYRVRNEALQDLNEEAARLARRVGRVTYTAVRREHNELADRLVNEALDRVYPRLYFAGPADVAQLARASACHAEGRGFESHHPLYESRRKLGGFRISAHFVATGPGPVVRFESGCGGSRAGRRVDRPRLAATRAPH